MKNANKMTIEEIDAEIDNLIPDREENILHVKEFLTDCTESNGFIHAELTARCRVGLDGQFVLADCSRMIHLELVPTWYQGASMEDFEKEYKEKLDKLDLISSTLLRMKEEIEMRYETEKRLVELHIAKSKLEKETENEGECNSIGSTFP